MITILKYFLLRGITFFIIILLCINLDSLFGEGFCGSGPVVCAITVLSTVVVVCTYAIIEAMNKSNP